MMENNRTNRRNKKFVRKDEEQKLISQLLFGPQQYLPELNSDETLDRQLLKIKLLDGRDFIVDDYVATELMKYESKFFKDWFYRLADLYKVNRNVMDVYVKPDFVRRFIIDTVYARFPRLLLRTLRSKNRRIHNGRTKLYHHLKKDVSEMLDVIIGQIYTLMGESNDPLEFKKKYSSQYKVFFQTELF